MAGEFPAVDYVMLVPDPSSPSQMVPVLSMQEVSCERTNSEDDISAKRDARARRVYPEGAQQSYSISGSFIATTEPAFVALKAAALSGSAPKITATLDNGQDTFTGEWQITTFSTAGGAFGAVTGSIALVSSGPIVVAPS